MVILGQPRDDHDYLARCLLSFKQQGVAGVIYLDADTTSNALPEALQACPLPLVAVSQTLLTGHHDQVVRDNRQAASIATRYLIERGHRYIAYIGGQDNDLIRQQRLLGLFSTLEKNGMTVREEFAPACSDNTQAASIATRQLLEKIMPLPPCCATRLMQ